MVEINEQVVFFFSGALPSVLLYAMILTLPVSWGLLWWYRRSVLKLMGARAVSEISLDEEIDAFSVSSPKEELEISTLAARKQQQISLEAQELYKRVKNAPWRSATVYGLGVLLYAILIAIGFFVVDNTEIHPRRLLFAALTYIWVVMPIFWIVLGDTQRTQFLIVGAYALLYISIGLWIAATSTVFTWKTIMLAWYSVNLWPSLALIIVLNRRIRAIGPLVLFFLFFGIAGAISLFQFIANNENLRRSVVEFSVNLGLSGTLLIGSIFLVGFLTMGLLGWLMLNWVKKNYQREKISDQSILVNTVWLLFLVIHLGHLSFHGIF